MGNQEPRRRWEAWYHGKNPMHINVPLLAPGVRSTLTVPEHPAPSLRLPGPQYLRKEAMLMKTSALGWAFAASAVEPYCGMATSSAPKNTFWNLGGRVKAGGEAQVGTLGPCHGTPILTGCFQPGTPNVAPRSCHKHAGRSCLQGSPAQSHARKLLARAYPPWLPGWTMQATEGRVRPAQGARDDHEGASPKRWVSTSPTYGTCLENPAVESAHSRKPPSGNAPSFQIHACTCTVGGVAEAPPKPAHHKGSQSRAYAAPGVASCRAAMIRQIRGGGRSSTQASAHPR